MLTCLGNNINCLYSLSGFQACKGCFVGTKKKQEGLAAGFPAAEKSVAKKSRQVRDSFTFPESDYAVIDVLKARAGSQA